MDNHFDEEYEIQRFGFSAQQFTEQFRNLVSNNIKVVVTELAECLINKVQSDSLTEDRKSHIRDNVQCVSADIYTSLEPALKNIDELNKKNFTISPQILLEDDYEKQKYANEQEEIYIQKLQQLENIYKQNAVMIKNCYAELEMYNKIQKVGEMEDEILAQVGDALDKTDETISLTQLFQIDETLEKLKEN